MAPAEGITPDELISRRRFFLAYMADDLERLRRRQAGPSLVAHEMSGGVPGGRERERLKKRSVDEACTVADFKTGLRVRTGLGGADSRLVRRPESLKAGLVVAAGEADRLIKLLHVIVTGTSRSSRGLGTYDGVGQDVSGQTSSRRGRAAAAVAAGSGPRPRVSLIPDSFRR